MVTNEIEKVKSKIAAMIVDQIETIVRKHDERGLKRLLDNLEHNRHMVESAGDDYRCVFSLFKRLYESESLSPKESTLIEVFMYLLVAEGQICPILDLISYLLIATGHDLYSLTKRGYVKDDMDKIRKVEMSTKIQFLRHHGFTVLTKEYDSTLRNDIAHHNYKVDEEGILWVRGDSVKLLPKVQSLVKIMRRVTEAIEEATIYLEKKVSN